MNGIEIKKTLQEGGTVYGTMLTVSRSPRWANIFAQTGLDYIIIDTEHAPRSRSEIADLLAAFENTDMAPIVRIPIPSSHYVTMALDAGAQGILAPYCETVDEVKETIGAAKWRPLKGKLVREVVEQNNYPSDASKRYLEQRSEKTICIIGIESVPAIENLDDILQLDGIDAIFVGPNDLTISLGIPNEYENPIYEEALRKIIAICEKHNTPVMIHHQNVELSKRWLREGAKFVLHSTDARSIHNAIQDDFSKIREHSQSKIESDEVI